MEKKTLLSWSSGKDSAWALHLLHQDPNIEVVGLFCTINQEYGRVAMHAVRVELLQQQADSVGLPLQLIPIPNPCSNAEYETIMHTFIGQAKDQGVEACAFGDLFLEDVRQYRESRLSGTGITPIFPLWGRNTTDLSSEMVTAGLRAQITCVDPTKLASDFSGREYDESFLDALPPHIDPCGENGEFHSFAFDGPMFRHAISINVGETVSRDGFVFTDLTAMDG